MDELQSDISKAIDFLFEHGYTVYQGNARIDTFNTIAAKNAEQIEIAKYRKLVETRLEKFNVCT